MTAINRFGFFAIPTRIREVFKSVRFACGFARREIDQSARSRYEIAKESKEAELKKDEDEKAEKEGTLEECNAKIEHFTAVISQAQQDIT